MLESIPLMHIVRLVVSRLLCNNICFSEADQAISGPLNQEGATLSDEVFVNWDDERTQCPVKGAMMPEED